MEIEMITLDKLIKKYKNALRVAKEIEKDGLVHSLFVDIVADLEKLKYVSKGAK